MQGRDSAQDAGRSMGHGAKVRGQEHKIKTQVPGQPEAPDTLSQVPDPQAPWLHHTGEAEWGKNREQKSDPWPSLPPAPAVLGHETTSAPSLCLPQQPPRMEGTPGL